ncbi:MAG: iron-containing alcohol dehydrogenase [Desulfobacterales bacterium]|nr:iron-containing alcohol dehydrogenase [Desulfobacterales bacterium]
MKGHPMSHFSFLCRTKLSVGTNALEHLPFDLSAMGSTKPLVIQDKAAHLSKAAKLLTRAFKDSGMAIGISPPMPEFDEQPNALSQFIKSAYTTYTEKGYDAIIALGHSQASDMAKALNIAVSMGPEALKGTEISQPLAPFIYLPVGVETDTAASGQTRFNNLDFTSDFLAPDQVLISPELLIADDRETLLNTSLFCLSLGSEVIGLSGNPPAMAYAAAVIRLADKVLEALTVSGLNPDDNLRKRKKEEQEWQNDLVQANIMAGYLRSEGLPALCLAIAEQLSMQSRLSKGHAMLLTLPTVLEVLGQPGHNTNCSPFSDLSKLLLPLEGPKGFSQVPENQQPQAAIQAIRSRINALYRISKGSLPRTLEEAGWNEATLKALGDKLMASGVCKGIETNVLDIVLTHALTGKPVTGI